MNALSLTLIRVAFLAVLWLFVIAAIGVVRTDLLGTVAAYALLHGSGLLFVVLLLAPDLSALGYLVNVRIGALTYNFVHTYVLPGIVFALGFALNLPIAIQIALIWFAHIGMDRALCFGLKYPTEFNDTHLQHV